MFKHLSLWAFLIQTPRYHPTPQNVVTQKMKDVDSEVENLEPLHFKGI